MNYIDKWFHFYDTTESFELHRKQDLINPDSICFLKETSQIYTQGTLFGICKERYERLEQLVYEHDAKINNILGIEGPSINDGIVNNIADIVNFLDGFTDEDNLKDFLNAMKSVLEAQINEVNNTLSDRITALADEIHNDSESLHNAINAINSQIATIDTRLDDHNLAISALNNSLASHIREYNLLKTNYDNFKSYAESKFTAIDSNISSIIISISTLQQEFINLDEKFDDVENEISETKSILEDAEKLVRELENRFGETLADIEQFKRDINTDMDDFKELVGAPNGIAPLDGDAKVPSAYLPSYVDDVLEYTTRAAFPLTGETGKIYVSLDDNLTYRWSGSTYIEISKSLGLGETATTAYPGNKGKKNADNIAAHRVDYNNPHKVTKAQLGLDRVDNTRDIDKPISTAVQEALNDKVQIEPGKGLVSLDEADKIADTNAKVAQFEEELQSEINRATAAEGTINAALATHKSDNTNPHGVTKAQVGLGNVDNTSDADKPISTAQQTKFAGIASTLSNINQVLNNTVPHISNISNPHNVTKEQVGLGNVDNTSDLSKPISYAVQNALNTKVDKVEGKGLSTEDFTTLLKTKLENLTNYEGTDFTAEIEALKLRLDTLVGSNDTTAVIDTFQEIEAFLQGITNTETLTGLLQEMKSEIIAMIPNNVETEYEISLNITESDVNELNNSGVFQKDISEHYDTIKAAVDNKKSIAINFTFDIYSFKIIITPDKFIDIVEGTYIVLPLDIFSLVSVKPVYNAILTVSNNTEDYQALLILSSIYTGSSSQFIKGDGSLDSQNYAAQTWVQQQGYWKTTEPITDHVTIEGEEEVLATIKDTDAINFKSLIRASVRNGYVDFGYNISNDCFFSSKEIFANNYKVLHTGDFTAESKPLGSVAKALNFKDSKNNVSASYGTYWNRDIFTYAYIGFGTNPYLPANGLIISPTEFLYLNNKIWHAGNDGPDSGLDSDTLDGYHASSFALAANVPNFWTGTQAEYDAIATKDDNTFYYITD